MRRSLTQIWTPQEGIGRKVGSHVGESAGFTAANGEMQVYADSGNTDPMRLSVTPSCDCWWPVHANLLARNVTAAWGDLYVYPKLNTADADGVDRQQACLVLHNALPYASVSLSTIWKLTAGVAYQLDLKVIASTGGIDWRYYKSQQTLIMVSPGIIPR